MSLRQLMRDWLSEKYMIFSTGMAGLFEHLQDSETSVGVILAVLSFMISAFFSHRKHRNLDKLNAVQRASEAREAKRQDELHQYKMERLQAQAAHEDRLRQLEIEKSETELRLLELKAQSPKQEKK